MVNPQDTRPEFFTSSEVAPRREVLVLGSNLPGEKFIHPTDSRLDGVWMGPDVIRLNAPITKMFPDGSFTFVDMIRPNEQFQYDSIVESMANPEQYEPEASSADEPHQAMLNPSRKLRIPK